MTKNDLEQYHIFFNKFNDFFKNNKNVLLLSPWKDQIDIIENYLSICPKIYLQSDWDLNDELDEKYDVIFACNVFHYISDPYKCINNVLKSCDCSPC